MIYAAIAAFVAVHFIYLGKYPIFWLDDIGYSEPAWQFLQKGTFANNLMFSEHSWPGAGFDITNVGMGRIFLFAQALTFKLFGFGPYQGRILQLLMGFLSIYLVYWIARRYYDRETGWLAAGLWGLSHTWWITAHQSRPDMMAICAILGTVVLFEKACK